MLYLAATASRWGNHFTSADSKRLQDDSMITLWHLPSVEKAFGAGHLASCSEAFACQPLVECGVAPRTISSLLTAPLYWTTSESLPTSDLSRALDDEPNFASLGKWLTESQSARLRQPSTDLVTCLPWY